MGDILFLSHRIPFPPDRGDKIRSHHILKSLTRIAPVHVATFADDDADMAEVAELSAITRSHKLIVRSKPLALAGLQAIATRQPVSLTAFHDAALASYVADVLARYAIDTIFVFSGQMGQYVPKNWAGRLVVDFVDADSAKFEAYAANGRGPRAWIDAREGRKLLAEEARLAARADVSLLVTREEAELFACRLPPGLRGKASVHALPNGIDAEFYDPRAVAAEPRLAPFAAPRLIFTGQMDYAPNVAACLRMARRIMPMLRRSLPQASFHVVGRKPVAELVECHGQDGVQVWGRVDDVRTWLKGADLAVAPLEIARGVQNKVLEAMAMELPVVLSSEAATGIPAKDGEHFAIANSDEAFVAAILASLADRNKARARGEAARKWVVDHASWQAALASLPGYLGIGLAPKRHVA